MFNAAKWKDIFENGQSFGDYVLRDSKGQSWTKICESVSLSAGQKSLLAGFTRQMNVLVMSSIWCGDCVEQCPLIEMIASGSEQINLRFVDRDQCQELKDALMINAGNRVPIVVFLAEDFEFCAMYGDRTLSRYRQVATALNGACSTGLGTPPAEHSAAAIQEWLNEFERVQLMLQTSARLRKLHGEI